jgi:hypothetical protein
MSVRYPSLIQLRLGEENLACARSDGEVKEKEARRKLTFKQHH